MENIKNGIFTKLDNLIEVELQKESPDTDVVYECIDGILRLEERTSYQLTKRQRSSNVRMIVSEASTGRFRSKLWKTMLAVAVINTFIFGTVIAYPTLEIKIADYGIYSEVSVNYYAKAIDREVVVTYVPEGYEITESKTDRYLSKKEYSAGEDFILIDKDTIGSCSINTEHGAAHIVETNGIKYIFFGEDVYGRGVIWFDRGYCYGVFPSNLSEEEMLKIAVGVS